MATYIKALNVYNATFTIYIEAIVIYKATMMVYGIALAIYNAALMIYNEAFIICTAALKIFREALRSVETQHAASLSANYEWEKGRRSVLRLYANYKLGERLFFQSEKFN